MRTNEPKNQQNDHFTDKILEALQTATKEMAKFDRSIHRILLSRKYQREILQEAAHVSLDDDIVKCYASVKKDEPGKLVIQIVSKDNMQAFGLTFEDLEQAAEAYEEKSGIYRVQTLLQAAAELVKELDEDIGFLGGDEMVVATNEMKIFGAGAVLNSRIQEQLAGRYPGGYYIIPSSVHEVIAVDKKTITRDSLNAMIKETNEMEVPFRERLADCVYEIADGKLRKA